MQRFILAFFKNNKILIYIKNNNNNTLFCLTFNNYNSQLKGKLCCLVEMFKINILYMSVKLAHLDLKNKIKYEYVCEYLYKLFLWIRMFIFII